MKYCFCCKRLLVLVSVLATEVVALGTLMLTDASLRAQSVDSPPPGMDLNRCGNNIPESDNFEECDEGWMNGTDLSTCNQYCQDTALSGDENTTGESGSSSVSSPVCGNGTTEDGEQCDDGNSINNDGCSSSCKREVCGDGVRQTNEECDDGNSTNNDNCTNSCKQPRCGDNIVQGGRGEECDDGNADQSDNCTNSCKQPRCGDGIVQTILGEICDKGPDNGSDACTTQCLPPEVSGDAGGDDGTGTTGDTGSNEDEDETEDNGEPADNPVCGNGKKEAGEACDDGNTNNDDRCSSRCTLTYCGDGIIQVVRGETCDDGNKDNTDGCSNLCLEARCGDGIIQSALNEECDEGSKNGGLGVHCSSLCKRRVTNDDDTSQETPSDDDADTDTTTTVTDDDDDADDAADALRRQREQQQELLRQRTLEAQRKREAELQQEEEQEQSNQEEQTENEDSVVDVLVCFNESGALIGNREQCAPDQKQFVPTTPVIDDTAAKEALRKKLLGENAADKRRQELVSTLQQARDKLQGAADSAEMRDEVEAYLAESIAWLESGIAYFSVGPRTLDEMNQMVPAVRQLLEQSMNIVRQERQLPAQANRDFTPILQKTERLLLKFRESFVALSQAGVALDEGALEQYVTAAELFNEIANVCVESNERCTEVNQVLEHLKVAQDPLQEAFGENPEIYQAVEAKFAE